jgi:amino acid adenylation domain-containing protein
MSAKTAPLSFGQQLFYQLDQATPGLIAYNVPRAFRIRGKLDVSALQNAFDALVERHEVLRSVYAADGDHPVQRVIENVSVPFERVDLSAMPSAAREEELARALAERAAYHFDLSADVLLRATLYKLSADQYVLFFLTHHVVSDGWSKSITFVELSELYGAFAAGRASTLAPLSRQFAEHARNERGADDSHALDEHLGYWREKLAGPLPVLDLPTDRARPTSHTFEGDVREMVLPKVLVDDLRRVGLEHGATLYMVLLAAYQTLLHRYSGQDDIITGSPTAGRDAEDTHGLIGYFAGALVLRNSFAGDPTFAEVLERVVNTCLDAYEHQDIPFERLVSEVQKGEHPTHAPLFQHVLTMEDTIPATLRLEGASLESMEVGVSATKFDLTLLFADVPDGLRLRLAFRTSLFDGDRIERMLGHLRTMLEAVVRDANTRVGVLPILADAERQQLLVEWNNTIVDEGAFASIAGMLEAHAARHPDRIAAQGEDGVITYSQLNERANRIAHVLTERGAGRGATVGVCLERTVAMISALLGVMKAGGAFVPLLRDLPASRLKLQIQESGASIVITTSSHRDVLGDAELLLLDDHSDALARASTANPPSKTEGEDVAYVLFTSGSTGVPKGVSVTHANLTHYTRAIARRLGLDLGGRDHWAFATVSTLGADLGHTAIFPSLASGGTLHVVPAAVSSDPTQFALYASVNPIDVLKITPNHLRALIGDVAASIARLPARWIVLGGEALPWDLALELARAGAGRVLNHYGPTETTVGVCTFVVNADTKRASATVPIGAPLTNTTAYVADARGQLVPIGVPGELFIGGAGVARGYIGRDDLTAERFVADRWGGDPGRRVYRTGDRVRWLSSGDIEFLGRTDDQVKVRGYRVELGEIEHVLRGHPGVAQCAVLLRESVDSAPRLVAYVVPRQAGYAVAHADRPTPQLLLDALAAQLPDYMVPSVIVLLDELPLTRNGKLDRAALPPLEGVAEASRFVGARSETEAAIAAIWSDVLKRDQIGVTESFLELGGHSLLAIRVLGRISKQLGVRLALRTLFDTPTVEEIAVLVDAELRQRRAAQTTASMLAEIENLSDEEVARLLGDETLPAEPEKR